MGAAQFRKDRFGLLFVIGAALLSLLAFPLGAHAAATPAPKITTTPASVNFSPVKAGGSSSKPVTIKNTGNADLVAGLITITGTDASLFGQTNDCSTPLPNNGFCTVTVTFSPTVPYGKKSATLNIASNDPKKPTATVKLSGQAPPPKVSASPMSVNLTASGINIPSAAAMVTIKNTGISDLNISSVTLTGTNASLFEVTDTWESLLPSGESCSVNVTFTPDSTGTKSASLLISSDDPKKPLVNVKLTGKIKIPSEQTSPASIVFDYTYDTNGFFTPERRVLMDKATAVLMSRIKGTKWTRVDTAVTGGEYDLAFINPSTLAVSWNHNVVIPENQITIYLGASDFKSSPFILMQGSEGDGATQLMSIRNVSGGISNVLTSSIQYRPVNASITFDLQGVQGFNSTITRQWHFDSDGNLNTDDRNPSDPHYYDYSDFYTAAIHELGHVLGIHNPQAFSTILEYDTNFCSAYLSRVQSDGSGGAVFTGSHAKQLYYNHIGQDIPLNVPTKCHWADGVRSVTADGWTSLTYESSQPFRHGFSELEFGALRDIGYTISAN